MARRKKETEIMEPTYQNTFELTPGFYLVDSERNLKTKTVTRGKPGETRTIVTEPIRCRTIAGAKDVASVASGELSILCVVNENIQWPIG